MTFTPWTALALAALGLVVGAFGTLIGAGGGFVLTPILLLLYPHDPPKTVTAISLAVVFANACSGSAAYARQRRIDYRSGLVFAAATLPGSVLAAVAVAHVSRRAFEALMAGVLLLLGTWLLAGARARRARPSRGRERVIVDLAGQTYRYRVSLLRGALYSLGVGFVSTFLGIGGGVMHVPLLARALGFPVHVATATSHFVLAIMAGAATITHAVQGSFAVGDGLRRALALAAGVVVGAQLGAHLSLRLAGHAIERLLGLALVALALRFLVAVA
ncbi:MAG TPA: sulfite exporter TauE/SafE family protein [Gaiellaceae bacterium]|nr:sulfite exporter TauE/SafE family protein [Gaiellaceae bacterium]